MGQTNMRMYAATFMFANCGSLYVHSIEKSSSKNIRVLCSSTLKGTQDQALKIPEETEEQTKKATKSM